MLAALLLASTAQQPLLIEGFEQSAAWRAQASDGVSSRVETVPGVHGKALRLDYDFNRVSGYAFATRKLPVDFPKDYVLSLRIRGAGGVNDLQLKFVDASGENVWWYRIDNFRATEDWQTIRIPARKMEFAWGPTKDKMLRSTASVELVMVRGRDGGSGHIIVDDLELTPLPTNPPALPAPKASDPAVLDGNPTTAWKAKGGDALTIDFGGRKLIGGLMLHWLPEKGAQHYAIASSDDGTDWQTVRRVDAGDGGDDPIRITDTETRYLRLTLPRGAPPAALGEVMVEPPQWGTDDNAMIAALAKTAPRGTYPRGYTEQPYWTLVGTDGGHDSGLISEDGAIEVAKGGFRIEPFVLADGKRFDWANVKSEQSLEDGYLPMPHVLWNADGWSLETSVFADETQPRLMARWRLTNHSDRQRTLTLALAVRPFQVNPPAQFLSQQGGVSPISAIAWEGDRLRVTSPPAIAGDPATARTLVPLQRPDAVHSAAFDQGALSNPALLTGPDHVSDPQHLASASLVYRLTLAPGQSADIPMAIPFAGSGGVVNRMAFDQAHEATAALWRSKLDRVEIAVPAAHQAVADTVKSALAQVLMSRNGPILKPGTRSYNRSWVRDGAMMSDTLLRLGVDGPVAAFTDWYSQQLFDNGKVPCCVDYRGPDPVPENDAQGEYIHLVTQLYRYTGDEARLKRQWPGVEAAYRYMEQQRQSERTPANQIPDRRMLFGLMPPSISHEGYSAKPQYSLWDDFWALTGYKDAALGAKLLNRPDAKGVAANRDQFAHDIQAAIAASAQHWKIDYIPGATSLGDWDATSTTIALTLAGEQDSLDPEMLRNTFERQWAKVLSRRTGKADWADYTPYELRNISAFVRLGWRERAQGLLDFYMGDRRPAAWNQWAEVVGRDSREIRFIGDMPHAWVASDFIRVALDLFAYHRMSDDALILGAGLTPDWLSGDGTRIQGLRTVYGTLDLAMQADDAALTVTIGGDAAPPGGFVLPWPLNGTPGAVQIDGQPARFGSDGLHIAATRSGKPIRIVIRR